MLTLSPSLLHVCPLCPHLCIHRRSRSTTAPDRIPVQWDLWGSYYDHRLWELAHVQHILFASQSLPVRSPWRLCGHGANHCSWTGHWSHHCDSYLYHHTFRWVGLCFRAVCEATIRPIREKVPILFLTEFVSVYTIKINRVGSFVNNRAKSCHSKSVSVVIKGLHTWANAQSRKGQAPSCNIC